ncbi:MAG: hypothetical protein KAQ65_09065 [Candidatus Thorarchaeota archaeon]|nr:hypothetical protein [Candidatus Thorarchaeota archaeon]
MTCYFRHIKWIFEEIGVEVSTENKKDLDRKIHDLVGVDYKNCSAAWKEVKKKLADDEVGFVVDLKKALT